MHRIKTYNTISAKGLDRFERERYEVGQDIAHPDALLLRSHKLQEAEILDSVTAIARAGAGVNNIPLAACSERGIPVASGEAFLLKLPRQVNSRIGRGYVPRGEAIPILIVSSDLVRSGQGDIDSKEFRSRALGGYADGCRTPSPSQSFR